MTRVEWRRWGGKEGGDRMGLNRMGWLEGGSRGGMARMGVGDKDGVAGTGVWPPAPCSVHPSLPTPSPLCHPSPQHSPEAPDKAWEYASLWGGRFHLQRRAGDACRRRCWRRHMVPELPSSVAAIFLLEGTAVLIGMDGGMRGMGVKGGTEGWREGWKGMEGQGDVGI